MALELLTFLGLAILVEGVLLALMPGAISRMMAEFATRAPERLRHLGLVAAIAAAAFLMVLAHLSDGAAADDARLGFPVLRGVLAGLL